MAKIKCDHSWMVKIKFSDPWTQPRSNWLYYFMSLFQQFNVFRTVVMNCENLKPSSSSILKLQVMGMFVNKMKYPPNMVFSPFFWLNLASWFFLFLSKWLKEFGCFLKKSPIAYTLFLFVKHHQIFSIGFQHVSQKCKRNLKFLKFSYPMCNQI